MNEVYLARYRLLAIVASALVLISPIESAFGQAAEGTSTTITVDAPTQGQGVAAGEQVNIGGWAIDRSGPGTGVDGVHVFLDGPMGQGTRLGAADYGRARPDVASALGNSELANSGFDLLWTVAGLSSGRHTLYVYARSLSAGWVQKIVDINLAPAATPTPSRPPMYPGGSGGPYTGRGPAYDYPLYPAGGPYDSYGAPYPLYPGPGYCPSYGPGYGSGSLGYAGAYCLPVGYPLYPPIARPVLAFTPGSASVQPPTGVTAAATSSITVRLTWTPSPSPGVTTYSVLQCRGSAYDSTSGCFSGFVPAVVSNLTNVGATVSGLTPTPNCGYAYCPSEYTFQVIAVGVGGIQSAPATSNRVQMPVY